MKSLTNTELSNYNGGGFVRGACYAIAAADVFFGAAALFGAAIPVLSPLAIGLVVGSAACLAWGLATE